ncbi:MAG: siderophore ABC transporter substrate-binding protein [Caldicoprobacterales bacterium]|jgi:iron complex transport system substrate-binding protein|nr:siderophore ABC transporter substrate-binding protein [Clostridiales bacterium]
MNKIIRFALALSLIVSIIVLSACGSITGTASEEPGSDENSSLTIKHELDEITLEKKPERVVVFDFGVLDIMDYIGEDVVGLPKQSLPPYLDKYNDDQYTNVGSLKEPNFETIYELKPDLIIISARQASLYDEFEKIAPTLYLDFKGEDYLNSFKNNVTILGQIFDKEEMLVQEIETIEKEIKALHEQASASSATALFIMANDGNLSVYGADSRFGILHNEFGLAQADENIEASTHGQKITFEYILDKDPDYLFVMDRAAVVGGETSAQQVMDNEFLKSTKAYKNQNMIYLDPFVWYMASGGITGLKAMIDEVQSAISK